ncbi:FAD-dependent monooxygenase [Saccharothrix longispora]|uniref:FAD-dependent monooxygenase n=1 Tax=Saccharothrix longispora TaxID=33920 RepID=UPI0028FD4CDE|nr:FAD-dependent monooxygenase [Saccharothrix longispora]MBY8847757.1 FAD-dependent monooxygenase [Saccharothrix sp. MB29]MDU0287845.1 FAD-dependent monooxygenase [Saccharothrix longispora]
MSEPLRVPVLIAGGGVTGLSAAVFLAHFGVPSLLAERRPAPLAEPRARSLNPPTVELYRAVGLERAIRAVRSPVADHTVVAHAESVAGPERVRLPDRSTAGGPGQWVPIDQDQLEPVLRDHAGGADVRYGTEVVEVEHVADGVLATLRSAGGDVRVHAGHLVVADGARSALRDLLGIGHSGPGTIARKLNVHFEADLAGPLRGRRVVALTVANPAVRGFLTSVDGARRWRFAISLEPGQVAADFTRERCAELVRAAIGADGVPIAVERVADTTWDIAGRVADRMRVDRVLIAGDAAHTMPPVGSFGVATGVQDAFNLAWKLGLVHRGVAGEELMATYEAERLPVAWATTKLCVERYRVLNGGPGDAAGNGARRGRLMFECAYPDGAFVPDPDHPRSTRVAQASTGDLLGGWALLTGAFARGWDDAAARAVVPVTCRPAPGPLVAEGVPPDGAVLLRPDGFAAWWGTDPGSLHAALDRVLCRGVDGREVDAPAATVEDVVGAPAG